MAKWIPENQRPKSSIWLCSECGNRAYYIIGNARKGEKPETIPYRFCPNCGTRMNGRKLIESDNA